MKNIFKNAKWIFVKGCETDICNAYFDYAAQLNIEGTQSESVNLYISSATLYAVYVND